MTLPRFWLRRATPLDLDILAQVTPHFSLPTPLSQPPPDPLHGFLALGTQGLLALGLFEHRDQTTHALAFAHRTHLEPALLQSLHDSLLLLPALAHGSTSLRTLCDLLALRQGQAPALSQAAWVQQTQHGALAPNSVSWRLASGARVIKHQGDLLELEWRLR